MNDVARAEASARYFDAIRAALAGLDIFMRDARSGLKRHNLVAEAVATHIASLSHTLTALEDRLGSGIAEAEKLRISRADSGFPVFQHILELDRDRRDAEKKLASLPDAETLRHEMADFILRRKAFPTELRSDLARRHYLESLRSGNVFAPFTLPETIRVSVNPKNQRPFYVVHWAGFDGVEHLPLIYMASLEDSTDNVVRSLVGRDGQLNAKKAPDLPVPGLLNPDFAHAFDRFAEANAAYSLSPATIATNMDRDFETLHPKQVRRIVLGPFWTEGVTRNNPVVSDILSRVSRIENAWLLTWTVQEVFSKAEVAARKGLWSSTPAREEFHIETDDLEAARMGVSRFEKHALVPHEAYQALYASGAARTVFDGFTVHIIANGEVITDA